MPASVKLIRKVNDSFSERLDAAFEKVFEVKLETEWSFMSMARISRLASGKKLNMQQKRFIQGYAEGYHDAVQQIKNG